MNMSQQVSLNQLLKKTEHYDKDERYMATSDLCEILKKHAASSTGGSPSGYSSSYQQQQQSVIDASTERRICTAVLKLLDDDSNDVQAIAVKTLGVLLTTVHEEQVIEIADRLCTLVLDNSKSELRDVYTIGLRTLVKTVPLQMGDLVSHRLVGRLIDGIRQNSTVPGSSSAGEKSSEEISVVCLDVMTDLLTRFGSVSPSITRQHEQILSITLSQLASDRHVVRKRAGSAIGSLSTVISDALLVRLVESLLSQIELAEGIGKSGKRKTRAARKKDAANANADLKVADTRSLIQTMCTVSGAVGHRLGQEQIDRIIPIFLRFCEPDDAVTGDEVDDDDEDMDDADEGEEDEAAISLANELRESCFAGFESFILRCSKEVEPHLKQIVHSALSYMRYDPNYSYGDEDDDEDGDDGSVEEEEDEYEDDDEYSDEDDMSDDDDDSWKVRRSAIRALAAVVESSKHNPSKLWIDEFAWRKNKSKTITVAGALVNRTKEREENCRVDIIDCFARLLSITIQAAKDGVVVLSSPDAMDTSSSSVVIDLCTKYSPAIVKACEKQLSAKKGGERTKSSAMALLSVLSSSPGGVGSNEQIASVFIHIRPILSKDDDNAHHRKLSAGSKTLKLDALCLVRTMITGGSNDAAHLKNALLEKLLTELCSAVQEDWYKVIAEALRVLAEVPKLLAKAWSSVDDKSGKKEEMDKVATALYASIEPRLAAHDLDQEIKECALQATASLLSVLHSSLNTEQTGRLLSLLLERLKNETTRIAAIKTLSSVVSTGPSDEMDEGDSVDLSPILAEAVSELANLLRQQSRRIKQSALESLDIILRCNGGGSLDDALYESVLKELGAIILDSDLHMSHLSLRAAISVLEVSPSSGASVKSNVLPAALNLSTSPLLQDQALESLLSLFKELVGSNAVDFNELRTSLEGRLSVQDGKDGPHGKQTIGNLGKSIATITAATSAVNRDAVVKDILSTLESKKKVETQEIQLALLTSGDLGRLVDLSKMKGVAPRLQTIYLSSFDSSSEDVKHAAAYALGRASVGAMDTFLPAILEALEQNNEKKQYLLLSALRELIHCHKLGGSGDIGASVPVILPHLFTHSTDKEEGVRTMAAECLGSLTCLQPAVILPQLKDLAEKHSGKTVAEDASEDDKAAAKNDARACWTVATSVKFAIAGKVDPDQLAPFMPTFLALLKEEDIMVKNTALLMVYSAVHHTPQLVTGLMQEHILPSLYELARLKMKRVVDMGPFKHTVDDALPLRKAALSIFATCLEKCPSSLDVSAFMPVLAAALGDVEDVQLQAHQIVISMCSRHPVAIATSVESFVEPLEKTMNKKKGQKTGTELERLNDWIKSAVRVMVVLSGVDGAMNCRKFADFVERTRKNVKYVGMLESIDEEH